MFEFVRLDQPAGPIMLEDKAVTSPYFAATAVLRKIEPVFDELEDDVVTGQGKDQHYHAAAAFGGSETIARGTQVRDEIAIEFSFAVTMVADRIVKIHQALVRHQFTQVTHHLVGALDVRAEVSAGIREQDGQIDFAEEDGVQHDPGLSRVPQT